MLKLVIVLMALVCVCSTGAGAYFLITKPGTMLVEWQQMRTWHNAEAEVLDLRREGSDTRVFYQYHVDGVQYLGKRAYLAKVSYGIGIYHRELYRDINAFVQNRKPLTIWFDPLDHEHSIVDKTMRWELLMLMLFAGIAPIVFAGLCLRWILSKRTQH